MGQNHPAIALLQRNIGDRDAVKHVTQPDRQLGPVLLGQTFEFRKDATMLPQPVIEPDRGLRTGKSEFFVINVQQHLGIPDQLVEQSEEDVRRPWLGQMDNVIRMRRHQRHRLIKKT